MPDEVTAVRATSYERTVNDSLRPMPVALENLNAAISNIARYGDTDVFPYPVERHWFFERPRDVLTLLRFVNRNFDAAFSYYPIQFANSLASVGYTGFRTATQIDPLWNAYLLALVLEIGESIEAARLSADHGAVFSYRFKPDSETHQLFDPDVNWTEFQRTSLRYAQDSGFVLSTDISDFYPRIYHHRLENALHKTNADREIVTRILRILKELSGNTSYGLPVGGPAARLLAELALNRTDRLLRSANITFCRFVDDYRIFAATRGDALSALIFLRQSLFANEGLSLQKSKSRIMSAEEYVLTSPVSEEADHANPEEAITRSFMRLRIRYDPYSETADEDYEALRAELDRFDIVEMLARELRKTRIDESLTKRLIRAVKHLRPAVREKAILSLADSLDVLYPVFPAVLILLNDVIDDLSVDTQAKIYTTIRALALDSSHILKVPTNLSYAVRLLAKDPAEETEAALNEIYRSPDADMMLKRDVILAMAKRDAAYWISDARRRYASASPWEKRAFIASSYILGDEGSYWRKSIKSTLNPIERKFRDWISNRRKAGRADIPL